jgi:hypothetical protein
MAHLKPQHGNILNNAGDQNSKNGGKRSSDSKLPAAKRQTSIPEWIRLASIPQSKWDSDMVDMFVECMLPLEVRN